jgi:hypothetical protein
LRKASNAEETRRNKIKGRYTCGELTPMIPKNMDSENQDSVESMVRISMFARFLQTRADREV